MMQLGVGGKLRREFAGRSEEESFRRFQQQRLKELERREREGDIDEDALNLIELVVMMISASEAQEFRLELDRYDAATVAALEANRLRLEQVRERLDEMFAKAHVLPDGRRVFKTEDGLRVFDEHGQELDASTIEPEIIDDFRPRWEPVKSVIDSRDALERERTEILDYQARLDDARERLDSGNMSREEFDRLREELKTDMPEAVRAQIPELAGEPETEAETGIKLAGADIELNIADDMAPSSGAAKVPILG